MFCTVMRSNFSATVVLLHSWIKLWDPRETLLKQNAHGNRNGGKKTWQHRVTKLSSAVCSTKETRDGHPFQYQWLGKVLSSHRSA